MNYQDLPFDIEQMIAALRLWVETESPSYDPTSINRLVDMAAYDLAALGATVQRIPGRSGYGDTLRASFGVEGSLPTPGVLICCHADTVHPVGSLQTMPYRREGNKLFGAGVLSAKAGIVISLEAIRQLVRNNWRQNLPVTFLLIPDKEAGCPSTRELIEACAQQARYVLVLEPAATDGGLILGRHAVARYKIDIKHDTVPELKAQNTHSPISEMARRILDIESMSTDECSFSVGSIQSGQWVNFAEKCSAEVISQAVSPAAAADGVKKMLALNSPNPDSGLHVNKSVSLPLWQPDSNSKALFDIAAQVGSTLSLNLTSSSAANGSIGNITGALGVPTLDGLSARGLSARSSRAEYLDIDSLVQRGKLVAGLLSLLH